MGCGCKSGASGCGPFPVSQLAGGGGSRVVSADSRLARPTAQLEGVLLIGPAILRSGPAVQHAVLRAGVSLGNMTTIGAGSASPSITADALPSARAMTWDRPMRVLQVGGALASPGTGVSSAIVGAGTSLVLPHGEERSWFTTAQEPKPGGLPSVETIMCGTSSQWIKYTHKATYTWPCGQYPWTPAQLGWMDQSDRRRRKMRGNNANMPTSRQLAAAQHCADTVGVDTLKQLAEDALAAAKAAGVFDKYKCGPCSNGKVCPKRVTRGEFKQSDVTMSGESVNRVGKGDAQCSATLEVTIPFVVHCDSADCG